MKNEIDKDAYDLGMRVKELRLSFGWTQKELAAIVGTGTESIAGYERKYRYPPVDRLMKLARALHVTPDYLLGVEDAPVIRLDNLTDHEKRLMYDFVKTFIDKK